jgi:uncharacterized DUF497 family protein
MDPRQAFEWDETKRRSNLAKHGLDFEDALFALAGPRFEYASSKDGEDRIVAICALEGRLIAVVYTMRKLVPDHLGTCGKTL